MSWALVKGWHFGKNYPSNFNRTFGRLVHSQLVEHYVRTSDDLSVLGVPELVSNLTVWTVAKENGFPDLRSSFRRSFFSMRSYASYSKILSLS